MKTTPFTDSYPLIKCVSTAPFHQTAFHCHPAEPASSSQTPDLFIRLCSTAVQPSQPIQARLQTFPSDGVPLPYSRAGVFRLDYRTFYQTVFRPNLSKPTCASHTQGRIHLTVSHRHSIQQTCTCQGLLNIFWTVTCSNKCKLITVQRFVKHSSFFFFFYRLSVFCFFFLQDYLLFEVVN